MEEMSRNPMIRELALELSTRADHGALDGAGIVEQAAIFEAYLLAGSSAAATVPASAASRLEGKLDVILSRLGAQHKEVMHMAAAITAVQAAIAALSEKIAAESSVIDSAVALIDGFKDRIAALITPRTDPDTVAEINHLLDTVGSESDKLAAAVAAGSDADADTAAPGDPIPPADPAPVPDDGQPSTNDGQPMPDDGQAPGDSIVPPSTIPPDSAADQPTPESVAGTDEQPPPPPVDENAGSV